MDVWIHTLVKSILLCTSPLTAFVDKESKTFNKDSILLYSYGLTLCSRKCMITLKSCCFAFTLPAIQSNDYDKKQYKQNAKLDQRLHRVPFPPGDFIWGGGYFSELPGLSDAECQHV